jgi:uncharacterized protein YjgD (DUF1641 family)
MSESEPQLDGADRDALAAAIEQNPEAVAAFVERLDAVNELLDVVALGTDALTDDMVLELSGTAATLGEAADGMATEETVRLAEAVGRDGDDLADAMATVVELQRNGTLDQLVEVADVLSLATDALTDDMVVELVGTAASLAEVADTAAEEDTVRGIETLMRALGTASDPDAPAVSLGPMGLMRALRDPDVKRGMGYLVTVAKALGAGLRARDDE